MKYRLMIFGFPCTTFSIAKRVGRETEPYSGIGWELFMNGVIAKEKFKPDFIMAENNQSMADAVKEEVSKKLGFGYTEINSALVSAQQRKRVYWTGKKVDDAYIHVPVPQPEDRGILLKDILESGMIDHEKAYCLKHQAGNARDYLKKHHTQVAFEPVAVNETKDGKCPTLRATYYKDGMRNMIGNNIDRKPCVADPVCVAQRGRYDEHGNINQHYEAREDGKTNTLTTVQKDAMVAEPIRLGDIDTTAQAHRVYSPEGKSVNITANGGGQGAKTGLYFTPVSINDEQYKMLSGNEMDYMLRTVAGGRNHFDFGYIQESNKDKGKCVTANVHKGVPYNVMCEEINVIDLSKYENVVFHENGNIEIDGKMIYLVENGMIGYKDSKYPIKLKDGYYIIRKLTPTECERLQTMPDGYTEMGNYNGKVKPVSNTQRFKCIGNSWTVEVIKHIMSQWNIPLDAELEVLSLYDGIAIGMEALKELGYTNITYKAYEIDQHAMAIANYRHPEIQQCGDAFAVREDDWEY